MSHTTLRRRAAGFTLVEMLVALAVGMVVILAVVAVQKTFESQRRTSVSGNDLDNAGAYAMVQLDNLVRSAGSGFSQAYTQTYGCQLYASNGGSTLLPAPSAFGAPFGNVLTNLGGTVRMAPIVILPGATATTQLNGGHGSSDVLMVMGGAGAEANVQTGFAALPAPQPTSTTITTQSGAGFAAGDLILLMEALQSSGPGPCQINQIGSIATGANNDVTLSLSGTSVADPTSPYAFSVVSSAVSVGNASNSIFPNFQLVGVGMPNGGLTQLMSYDLLNLVNSAPTAMADGVMELHAVYLIEGTGGTGFSGVSPSGTSYGPSALMAGTTTATVALASIKAVRVGLILKSPLMEKMQNVGGTWSHVAPASLSLFGDVPNAAGTAGALTYTRTLDPGGVCTATSAVATNPGGNVPLPNCELDYRYRTVEITIPLRNPMLLS